MINLSYVRSLSMVVLYAAVALTNQGIALANLTNPGTTHATINAGIIHPAFDATLTSYYGAIHAANGKIMGYDYTYIFYLRTPPSILRQVESVVYGSSTRPRPQDIDGWSLNNQGPPDIKQWYANVIDPFLGPATQTTFGDVWYPKTLEPLGFSIPDYHGSPGETISVYANLYNPNSEDWNVAFNMDAMNTGSNNPLITTFTIPLDATYGEQFGPFSGGGIATYAGGSTVLSDNYAIHVIPAPSTLLLLSSGLAGVVGLRRKRLLK